MPALAMNVVAQVVEPVEKVGCSILHGIGFSQSFVAVRVDNDVDSLCFQLNVDVFTGHNGVAIIVDIARFVTVDMQLFTLERLDFRVLVERFVEHFDADLRCVEHTERLHNDDVHQSVAHGSLRGNIGIVAILRGVSTRNEECFEACRSVLVAYFVGLRLVAQSPSQHVFHIGDGPALTGFSKLVTDKSVESHATCAEKRVTIDDAIVELMDFAGVDNLNGLRDVEGKQQMAGQTVARSAGNDAQGRRRMDDGASHLVDCSVATNGNDNGHVMLFGFGGEFGCVSGISRQLDFVIESIVIEIAFDEFWDSGLTDCPRNGVHDENDFLFLHLLFGLFCIDICACKANKFVCFAGCSRLFLQR